MECEEYIQRRVKLGYVADAPTSIQLVDSIGNQVFDLLPIVLAGETDTSIELIPESKRIRYYPEEYTRTEGGSGCYYDICIPDIAVLINLEDLGNIDITPSNGDTIIYNSTTQTYEAFNLPEALGDVSDQIEALESRCAQLESQIAALNSTITTLNTRINQQNERIAAIESAIYNWNDDKETPIPRGTINITSGSYTGNNGIFSRTKNQNDDLNFA